MDSAPKLQYLVSVSDPSGRINFGCPTAAAARKKAGELMERGHVDVKICTPRGRILSPDEFEQLDG